MSVRSLISEPPDFRTSGASVVLVPPLAKPQTAQSSPPSAVRSAWFAPFVETLPESVPPVPPTVKQLENSDVSSVPSSVAVAVTPSPP